MGLVLVGQNFIMEGKPSKYPDSLLRFHLPHPLPVFLPQYRGLILNDADCRLEFEFAIVIPNPVLVVLDPLF